MYFDEELGKIYDVIAYILIYFNKNFWHETFHKLGYAESDNYFEFHDEIAASMNIIPRCLYPLFFQTKEKQSIILKFFYSKVRDITMKKFMTMVRNDEELKKISFNYYLGTDDIKLNILKISEILKEQKLDSDLLFETQLLLCNYEFVINELIFVMECLYEKISSLHRVKKKIAQNMFDNLDKEKYIKYLGTDIIDLDNAKIGFTFMNKYILYYNYHNNETLFLLGLNHDETVLREEDNKKVSLEHFFSVCSNPSKVLIIKELALKKEITVSELVDNIYSSYSTVARHLEDLRRNSIVSLSSQDSRKFYYKLNKSYFRILKSEIDKIFIKMELEYE